MRKLLAKAFQKWRMSESISDSQLLDAIAHLENGLSSVNLGGGLYKVRVARKGEGKSGGFRTLIVYKESDRAIFIHGFAKSDKSNISAKELYLFKEFASMLLSLDNNQLDHSVKSGALFPVEDVK